MIQMTRRPHTEARGPATVTAVRNLLLLDLTVTAARLAGGRPLSSTDVHEARKRLKRARALLALLRRALEEHDFETCDDALRATGKSFAASRDATVLARTYARIRKGQGLSRATAASLREPPRVPGRHWIPPVDPATACRLLRPGLERLADAPLAHRGWTALGPGLRAVYRRGRRAMAAATEPDPSGARLHAWRRHAKRYWHVLDLFAVVDPDGLRPVVEDLRRLSEVLGQEHDLALVAAHLATRPGGRGAANESALRAIAQRRDKLARRAFKLGARIYGPRPRDLERHVHREWRRWRRQ